MNTPDKVCSIYADKGVRIRTGRIPGGLVLFEGDAEALEFVGKLFLAQARDQNSCADHLSPRGAGSALFTKNSSVGIYIHRLPCLEKNGGPIKVLRSKVKGKLSGRK